MFSLHGHRLENRFPFDPQSTYSWHLEAWHFHLGVQWQEFLEQRKIAVKNRGLVYILHLVYVF